MFYDAAEFSRCADFAIHADAAGLEPLNIKRAIEPQMDADKRRWGKGTDFHKCHPTGERYDRLIPRLSRS